MNPRLPKDKSLDGVLSRNPDPPTMNAGMVRGLSLDEIKYMNARKRLMDMGADKVKRLLGDTHEGDYRHLFDTATNPDAFRHGIQDAGADEIMQLIAEFQGAGGFDKVKKSKESRKEYVKSPCCPAGVGTRERGGKIVCIDCEKELDAKTVLDMDRYHDYDEDGDGMYMRRSLDTDSAFDTAWGIIKEDIISMSDIQMMVKEVHNLVQIQGAHPMQAAAMVAEANYPDQRKLGRTLFAEYVKMMS